MKAPIWFVLAVWLIFSCSPTEKKETGPNAGLIGTWSFNKSSVTGKDTSYVWSNLDGQLIFTDKYYSIIYVNRATPRDTTVRNFFDKLTLEDFRKIVGPVTANSGSYKVEGDSILFYRDVALWPNAMADDRQPSKVRLPHRISKDSLVWSYATGNEYIWVRR